MVRICWDIKKCWNWKIEKLHEGWLILLLFVMICAWKFPPNLSQSPHPQTLAPEDLLAQQLRPSKGVQRLRGDVAHDLDRFSIPKRWKSPISVPKNDHGQFANNHCVVDTFCWMQKLIWFQISTVWRKVLGLGSKKRSNEIRQHSICIHLLTESRNATGPLEQYHNERPPAAPETKTFQGWNGYGKIFHVLTINKQRQESS